MELAEEDGPLRSTAHPLQVGDFLKRNLPGLWMHSSSEKQSNRIKVNEVFFSANVNIVTDLHASGEIFKIHRLHNVNDLFQLLQPTGVGKVC